MTGPDSSGPDGVSTEAEDYSTNGSGVGSDRKVNSALVTAWPEAFDIEADILKEDKATRFQTALRSALRTRKLFNALQCRPPTLSAKGTKKT